jgi:hypothetical protein
MCCRTSESSNLLLAFVGPEWPTVRSIGSNCLGHWIVIQKVGLFSETPSQIGNDTGKYCFILFWFHFVETVNSTYGRVAMPCIIQDLC